MEHRDLVGYGKTPPNADWPGGAHVAVSLVLNVEEGSERSFSRGDEINESVYDMIEDIIGSPNPTMESHFGYGTRAGYWRIMRVLEKYGILCTQTAVQRRWLCRPGYLELSSFGVMRSRVMVIDGQIMLI